MKTKLVRTTSICRIENDPDFARRMWRRYAYFQKGYFFSPAYKARKWDGKVRLVSIDDEGEAKFPSGLWDEVVAHAERLNVDFVVEDLRKPVPKCPELENWSFDKPLRWFQAECEKIATSGVSGGVFYLAPRAGKTILASRIISRFAEKTLFVVPSKELLEQGHKVMQARFPTANVTKFGSGTRDLEGDIVVAIMASVVARIDEVNKHTWGTLFVDEVHHCTGDGKKWKESVLEVNALRKFGLTGTLELPSAEGETAENGTIWVRGICGPVLYKRTQTDLVDDGALMGSKVTFLRHNAREIDDGEVWAEAIRQHEARLPEKLKKWESDCKRAKTLRRRAPKRPNEEPDKASKQTALYDLGIAKNAARNKRIVDAALERVNKGLLVLIDAQRVDHVETLYNELCDRMDPDLVGAVTAKFCKGKFKRPKIIDALNTGKLKVVVGNLLGEGVDLPNLNVVINAESGQGFNAVFQRMRHMNAVEGKEVAELVDIADHHHPQFKKWTKTRIDHYAKEAALDIEIEKRSQSI